MNATLTTTASNPYTLSTTSGTTFYGGTTGICTGSTFSNNTITNATITNTVPYFTSNDTFSYQPHVLITTGIDDDDLDCVKIILGGNEDKCKNKIQIIPGVNVYTQHAAPSRFRRFMLWLLLGVCWESTFEEQFIDKL